MSSRSEMINVGVKKERNPPSLQHQFIIKMKNGLLEASFRFSYYLFGKPPRDLDLLKYIFFLHQQ
ncbi:hypothetical protein ACI2OX_16290 [Bacillus sp. N9]